MNPSPRESGSLKLATTRQEPERSPAERALGAVAVAFSLLTIVPVWSLARVTSEQDVKSSRFAFPVVGLALGLLLAASSAVLQRIGVSPPVAAFVLVVILAALTGGLHLDGVADTGDGLFLWGDASRRLEVMRDPHVGSYGLTFAVLTLLGKYAALSSLTGPDRAWGLLGALVVSRTVVLVSAGQSAYARADGTGRLLVEATTPYEALAAAALVLLAATLCGRLPGAVAALVVLAGAQGLTVLAKHRLGGLTGDILGALIELGETAYLLALSCFF